MMKVNLLLSIKYYHQAGEKMYWIPITKGEGRMSYVIHLSDLTDKVRKELDTYYRDTGRKSLTLLLRDAVCKIFKNQSSIIWILN
jgi:hypothetical protein